MSGNFVHRGRRLRVLFTTAHSAGDLVYAKGFYGVVQDSIVAGTYGTLILDGVWNLKSPVSTLAMGTRVTAPAQEQATSLQIAGGATTGYNAIGRVIATGTATTAKVLLGHPNLGY
jgi:predicted RecA/RadA family phage recombinase